jgi:hypothetical protein
MSFKARDGEGIRTHGEKGHYPDEFTTRSQWVDGVNTRLRYLSNWDMTYDVIIPSGGGGGEGCCPRMISIDIDVILRPTSTSTGYDQVGLEDIDPYRPTAKQHFMGTAKFQDIIHNWGLTDPNDFVFSSIDLTEYINTGIHAVVPYAHPKVVGIDKNTVRIYANDPGVMMGFNNSLYKPNANTKLMPDDDYLGYGDNLQGGSGGTKGYPRFRITLQEKL